MSSTRTAQPHPTVAVLGGKGFVGAAIARALQQQNAAVTVIDKDEYASAKGGSFDVLINANGNSKKFLSRKDPAGEFKLSVASVSDSLHDFTYGLYVHLSTIDVYPDHEHPENNHEDVDIDLQRLSPYGLHKRMAEQLVEYYAENWLIFRMAGFVGPGLWKNSIHDMLTHEPVRVHLDSAYQYLHTTALAEGILAVIHAGQRNRVFNITGAGTITLREVAAMIPGYDTTLCPTDAPCEHYEVNNDRIQPFFAPPSTASTVRAFISNVTAGKEPIR